MGNIVSFFLELHIGFYLVLWCFVFFNVWCLLVVYQGD